MSMDFGVYVGPYIEIDDKSFNYEAYESELMEGRGEATNADEPLILVPNSNHFAGRQCCFDKTSECPLVELGKFEDEIRDFLEVTRELRKQLQNEEIDSEIKFGIVPSWS